MPSKAHKRLERLEAKRQQQVATRIAALNAIMAPFTHDELSAVLSACEKLKGNAALFLDDPIWVDTHLNATEQGVIQRIVEGASKYYV